MFSGCFAKVQQAISVKPTSNTMNKKISLKVTLIALVIIGTYMFMNTDGRIK